MDPYRQPTKWDYLIAVILTIAFLILLSLFTSGCGPHRKTHISTNTNNAPGYQLSPWYGPLTSFRYGPYEIYFHKSFTDKNRQCLLVAIETHWSSWITSPRGIAMIGAPRFGRIYFEQAEQAAIPSQENIYSLSSTGHANTAKGAALHVTPFDHKLPLFNRLLDAHQDPLLEGPTPLYTPRPIVPPPTTPPVKEQRWIDVDSFDVGAVNDAFALQQFIGCH